MDFRNARYINPDKSRIDMDIKHPHHGWVPITISQKEYPAVWEDVVRTNPPILPPGQSDVSDVAIELWRKTASVSKADFCLTLMRMGILTPQEAKIAAKGDWPPTFQSFLESSGTGMSADEIEVFWAGVTQIERNHPLFEEIRKYANITPKQADVMFGAPT